MAGGAKIPFFTDEDVPDSVGDYILKAGHDLTRLRDAILTGSPDPVVAATCREGGLVLVTHNYRDFRAISKSIGVTHGQMDRLCRVELGCSQVIAAARLEIAMSLIELEWAVFNSEPDSEPLRVFVGDKVIRTSR